MKQYDEKLDTVAHKLAEQLISVTPDGYGTFTDAEIVAYKIMAEYCTKSAKGLENPANLTNRFCG